MDEEDGVEGLPASRGGDHPLNTKKKKKKKEEVTCAVMETLGRTKQAGQRSELGDKKKDC
jgi:hypothetical protein